MSPRKSPATINRYRKGVTFEDKVRKVLHAYGYAVARGAGSKGTTKADLVAFGPHGHILLIQCKTDGQISAVEWNRLWNVSMRSLRVVGGSDFAFRQVAIPIIARKDERGGVLMDEIVGERVHRKPFANRRPFDWRCACTPPHDNLAEIDAAAARAAKAAKAERDAAKNS